MIMEELKRLILGVNKYNIFVLFLLNTFVEYNNFLNSQIKNFINFKVITIIWNLKKLID